MASYNKNKTTVSTPSRTVLMLGVLVGTPTAGMILGGLSEFARGDKSGLAAAGGLVLGLFSAVLGLVVGITGSFLFRNALNQHNVVICYVIPSAFFVIFMFLNLLQSIL